MVDIINTMTKIQYIKISRPRFWVYLLGPYLIGLAAADPRLFDLRYLLLFAYFTFPANIFIYGINDINDYDTDILNPKKQSYEKVLSQSSHVKLTRLILLSNIPFVLMSLSFGLFAAMPIIIFIFLGYFYSAYPIRAKIRPFVDTIFNALYAMPGVLGYSVVTGNMPDIVLILAAVFWCMAMHAYSAVPDIEADRKAGLQTIATKLGFERSLIFCSICYLLSGFLSVHWLGWFSFVAVIYLFLMGYSYNRQSGGVFSVYKLFPYINMLVGMLLFFWVSWSKL